MKKITNTGVSGKNKRQKLRDNRPKKSDDDSVDGDTSARSTFSNNCKIFQVKEEFDDFYDEHNWSSLSDSISSKSEDKKLDFKTESDDFDDSDSMDTMDSSSNHA